MWEKLSALFWETGIPCVFHLVTGAYCPGCGGTRAAKALLTGRMLDSFRYNPVVLYGAAAVGFLAVRWIAAGRGKGRTPSAACLERLLYGGLALALVNFIYKNYMLLVRGVDLLA